MTSLYEKYRPKTFDQVIGQDKLISRIRAIIDRGGFGGKAVWIAGQSGTGKTTIARIIAATCASDFSTVEVDAGECTPATIRDWERQMSGRPLGSNGWAIIINEAHGLRKDAIRSLLVALERIQPYVVWIFTTTNDGQDSLFDDQIDAHPLLSRCLELPLARRDLAKPMAERAREVAQAEGLDGQPVEKYIRMMQDCKNNLRMALQRIEAGAMLTD